MSKRLISKKYGPVGPDVDLDTEVILLPSGERLTNKVADEIADEILGRRGFGRPSLTGTTGHSPRVNFRVSEPIRERAAQQAAAEHISLSRLARKALERYLDDAAAYRHYLDDAAAP